MPDTRPPRLRALTLGLGALVLTTLALTACSSTDGPGEGESPVAGQKIASSLTALFEQRLEEPDLSDFEREVFERAVETGEISAVDYEEAFNRYQACMLDLGYQDTWTKGPDGLFQITPPASITQDPKAAEEYMERGSDCADGTVMRIEATYGQQQNNADLLADPREVAVQCLQTLGAVPADYSPEDLETELQGDLQKASFDAKDPEANQCLRGAGFAIALQ
ncbi:hypothetical protein ACFP63_16035 [Oerskovia jenensis]|uniref:Lipoprotein n=1 Tax=Oerskovia jenensis TaxID=162169 RepID=A0ABS2LE00_9CELL|nr:hypothetical protein [Oerskovia jenensis]MBM7478636.1 hypothetical protein [Oerskovia jenensis]